MLFVPDTADHAIDDDQVTRLQLLHEPCRGFSGHRVDAMLRQHPRIRRAEQRPHVIDRVVEERCVVSDIHVSE